VDGDGDLDAYTGNDQADQVWINQGGDQDGTAGTFADSGQSLGGSVESSDVGLSDLDGDSDLDAFVAVYGGPNKVYINQGFDQGGTEGVLLDSGQSLGGSNSQGLALGDLDGDGDVDAFVANWSQPDKVWLNGGGGSGNGASGLFGGSFQELDDYSFNEVALDDLDGDGDLDAFLVRYSYQDFPEVWLNGEGGDPPGTFSRGQELSDFGLESRELALGDVDNDGDVDAVVFGPIIPRPMEPTEPLYVFTVLLNGEGTNPPAVFSVNQEMPLLSSPRDLALGDLDNDGDLDALITQRVFEGPAGPRGRVQVLLNGENGDPIGSFGRGQAVETDELFFQDLALGDVDGDGDLDAVSAIKTVHIFRNGSGSDPLGVFTLDQQIDLFTSAVALGDLDGDGDLDLYLARAWSLSNRIWLNGVDGDEGTFTDSGQRLSTADNPDVALGDLDGDGDLDAFLPTQGSDLSVDKLWDQVWENASNNIPSQCLGNAHSRAVALGDLDGDGDLDAFVANGGGGANDSVWFNGQGRSCSCIVRHMYEVTGARAKSTSSGNSGAMDAGLFSFLPLSTELQTYLDLRQYMLERSPNGPRYARLFYDHNAEIYGLLVEDAALRDEGLATLQLWQPDLQALLDGQGDSVTISAEQVQAVDDFLANLSAAASPALQEVIAEERAKLPPPEAFTGMTLEEARGIVLADVTLLPIMTKQ